MHNWLFLDHCFSICFVLLQVLYFSLYRVCLVLAAEMFEMLEKGTRPILGHSATRKCWIYCPKIQSRKRFEACLSLIYFLVYFLHHTLWPDKEHHLLKIKVPLKHHPQIFYSDIILHYPIIRCLVILNIFSSSCHLSQ